MGKAPKIPLDKFESKDYVLKIVSGKLLSYPVHERNMI